MATVAELTLSVHCVLQAAISHSLHRTVKLPGGDNGRAVAAEIPWKTMKYARDLIAYTAYQLFDPGDFASSSSSNIGMSSTHRW